MPDQEDIRRLLAGTRVITRPERKLLERDDERGVNARAKFNAAARDEYLDNLATSRTDALLRRYSADGG